MKHKNEDPEIAENIGWIFNYLTMNEHFDDNNQLLNIMNDNGITKELIKMLNVSNSPSLKTIGNILTGNDEYTQKCIDFGVLGTFYNLLNKYSSKEKKNSNDMRILKELCWSISNITAGSIQQI